jgi:hypothetical protein
MQIKGDDLSPIAARMDESGLTQQKNPQRLSERRAMDANDSLVRISVFPEKRYADLCWMV